MCWAQPHCSLCRRCALGRPLGWAPPRTSWVTSGKSLEVSEPQFPRQEVEGGGENGIKSSCGPAQHVPKTQVLGAEAG